MLFSFFSLFHLFRFSFLFFFPFFSPSFEILGGGWVLACFASPPLNTSLMYIHGINIPELWKGLWVAHKFFIGLGKPQKKSKNFNGSAIGMAVGAFFFFFLKGGFTNFDNVRLNDAPRGYKIYPRAKDFESPDSCNLHFKRPRKRPSPSWPFLGLPSNSKCYEYMHNIFFIKSCPYMVAMISDLNIRVIFL